MTYNWQQPDWTNFQYDLAELQERLQQYVAEQGRLSGMLSALTDELQQQSVIDIMVVEAIKSFEIEGEFLSREEVLSSIRNNLGVIPLTKWFGRAQITSGEYILEAETVWIPKPLRPRYRNRYFPPTNQQTNKPTNQLTI